MAKKEIWENPKRSLWLNAAYKILADGEWHPFSEIYSVMYDLIPPGRAKRTTANRRKSVEARKGREHKNRPNDETMIDQGRNQIIIQTMHSCRHQLEIRKDGPDRYSWFIRLRADVVQGGHPRKTPPSGFIVSDPETRARQRAKARETRRETRRQIIDQYTDDEARFNNTVQQRAAVFTRPWLWPSNPAPVFRQDQHRNIATGYCSYTEEDNKEKWIVHQTWPTEERYEYFDIFELAEYNWRVRLF